MTENKKILLIGRSGRGKSTLANVITEAENKFKESGGSASETRKIQFEEFADEENNINYLVIDTPGIGDTKMSDNEVLDIIAEAVYLVRNGLSHVFFVINGRFDQYEMITYNLLRETIFDQDITKHTTITRTRFKDFKNKKKCQADIDLMVKEAEDKKSKLKQDISAKEKELANLSSDSNQYQELLEEIKQLQKDLKVVNLSEIIESCQRKVIYVDNPPISIAIADNEDEKRKREREEELQSNKKKRAKSREKVLEHLKNNCQNDSYKPEKLTNLSNEITEDMDNLLRSRKEYEEEMKKLKTNQSSSVSNQFAKMKIENKSEITIEEENQELTAESNDNFAVGEKLTSQFTILQMESKRVKLRREIAEKEKLIRQKVLKHIFNNYNDIVSVEGSSSFIDSMIDIKSWQEIHHEFTKELVKQWLSSKFDYEKTQKWAAALGSAFNPKNDVGFCTWLRDDKQLVAEKIKRLSHPYNVEDLRQEYAQQLVQENKALEQHNQQLVSNWITVHEDFAKEWYGKTYQQKWEEMGLTAEDARQWTKANFRPRDYSVVKEWKSQGFVATEAHKLIQFGLKHSEHKLACYLREKNCQLTGINLKELRMEFATCLDKLKKNAQAYLDKNYPLDERVKITELYINNCNLTGSLKLVGFSNLIELGCSENQLTNLDLSDCFSLVKLSCSRNQLVSLDFLASLNPTKIKKLSIRDNNFPKSDLNILSSFVNLEQLLIGSSDQGRIGESSFSKWTGSLRSLKSLTKLKNLYVGYTDVTGLEYLSESLTEFYCIGTNLAKELEIYGLPNDGNYIGSGNNYISLVNIWKQVQKEKVQAQQETQFQIPPK